jgi:hypothetical protein
VKKPLLTLALLAGAATAVQAQSQRVHFGLKAGVSFARFVGGDVPDNNLIRTQYRVGLSGGGLAEVSLAQHWAVQPELLYTSKGTKQIANSASVVYVATLYQNLGYLDIPVLLKYKIPHFFVEAGPQLGVLLHAKQTVESGISSTEMENRNSFKTTDLGYALGLGVQDTNGLLLGVRYNGGLVNNTATSPQLSSRNSTFHIYVGYVFGGDK